MSATQIKHTRASVPGGNSGKTEAKRRSRRPTSPSCRGLVKRVDDLEAVGVGPGEGVPLLAEEDVGLGDVGVDQSPLGGVGLVLWDTEGRGGGEGSDEVTRW